MDWIHCNQCFTQLEGGISLHLTSCGHMFCNNCLDSDGKSEKCLVCRMPCSVMKLVPDMKPDIQDYFTEPEEIIKKCCEVLQFQKQHRRRLLSYLLQSTKKFYLVRSELKRITDVCQKQHKQLNEYKKIIKSLQSQSSRPEQTPPFTIPISPRRNTMSPGRALPTPTYNKPVNKSTPYNPYQSNLLTPARMTKERCSNYSVHSQNFTHLEEKACSKPHPNLESLKTSLIKAAADIDMDLVRAAIDDWPRRLKACIQNHGGHFE